MATKGIKYVYDIAIKNQKALGDLANDTENLNESSQSAGMSLGKLGIIAGGAIAGFVALNKGINLVNDASRELIELSKQAATAMDLSSGFARNFGADVTGNLDQIRKASRGTISDMNLMEASNKASLLGVSSNIEDLAALMDTARIRGKELGLGTTQAFNDIVTGIGRGSPLILDNLGIKIPDALKETFDGMSEAEKTTALLNFAIEDGARLVEQYGGALTTPSDKFEQFNANIENAKLGLGEVALAFIEGTNVMQMINDAGAGVADTLRTLIPLAQTMGQIIGESIVIALDEMQVGLWNIDTAMGQTGSTINNLSAVTNFFGNVIVGLGVTLKNIFTLVAFGIQVLNSYNKAVVITSVVVGQGAQSMLNAFAGLQNGMASIMAGVANMMIGGMERGANGAVNVLNSFLRQFNAASAALGAASGGKISLGSVSTISNVSASRVGASSFGGGVSAPNIGGNITSGIQTAALAPDLSGLTQGGGGPSFADRLAGNQAKADAQAAARAQQFGQAGAGGLGAGGGGAGSGGSGSSGKSDAEKAAEDAAKAAQKLTDEELRLSRKLEEAKLDAIKNEEDRLIALARFKTRIADEDFRKTVATEEQKAEFTIAINSKLQEEINDIKERFDKDSRADARQAAQDEIDQAKISAIANRDERQKAQIEFDAKKDIRDFLDSDARSSQKRAFKTARNDLTQQELFKAGLASDFSSPTPGLTVNITGNNIDDPKRVDELVQKLKDAVARENQLSNLNISF